MKKKNLFLFILVLMIFLVGNSDVYGIPQKGKEKTQGTGDASKGTVLLDDGYYVPENKVTSFLKGDKRCTDAKANCWEVQNNIVVGYNAQGKPVDLDELNFWEEKIGKDIHGNLFDKDGKVYTKTGKEVTLPAGFDKSNIADEIEFIGSQPIIPLKDNKVQVGDAVIPESIYYKDLKQEGIEITSTAEGKIDYKIGDKQGSISYSTTPEGITSYTRTSDGKTESKLTTPKGTVCEDGCSGEDWEFKNGQLTNKETGERVEISLSADKKEIDEKKYKNGKLISWEKFNAQGQSIAEADVENGVAEKMTYYDPKTGKKTGIDFFVNGKEQKFTFDREKDKVCTIIDETEKCYTKEEAEQEQDSGLREHLLEAHSDLNLDEFIHGEWWLGEAFAGLQEVFNPHFGAQDLLGIGAPDEYIEWIDKYLAKYLGIEYYVSGICKEFFDVTPDEGVFIETPDGSFQLVANAAGETTHPKAVPMLCDENEQCDKGVCKKGLCYEDKKAETPIQSYFYRIEYGVIAPRSTTYTPDKVGPEAVSFNILLKCASAADGCKDFWIYKDNTTGLPFSPPENAIKRNNGESYYKVRVRYSPFYYNQICIVWDKRPKNLYGEEVDKEYCRTISKSELKAFENAKDSGIPGPEPGKEAAYDDTW